MKYYVGWDVGAWECKNRGSRDGILIINEKAQLIGKVFTGNIKDELLAHESSELISAIFKKCDVTRDPNSEIIIAIDAVLAWPKMFQSLFQDDIITIDRFENHLQNPMLFRVQESKLPFEQRPLSPITDRIGSQSTKAIFFLKRLMKYSEGLSTGIWSNDDLKISIIETYPKLLEKTGIKTSQIKGVNLRDGDQRDAYLCALLALEFDTNRESIQNPDKQSIDRNEGWIWYPKTQKDE